MFVNLFDNDMGDDTIWIQRKIKEKIISSEVVFSFTEKNTLSASILHVQAVFSVSGLGYSWWTNLFVNHRRDFQAFETDI